MAISVTALALIATIAGLCSIARLRPSIRNPSTVEVQDEIPVLKQTR